MKKSTLMLGLSVLMALTGCSSTDNKAKTEEKETEHTAAVYTCPMHPEVVSDKPARCPKCNMELVKKDK